MLEVNLVLQWIANDEVEQNICWALTLAGTTVKPDDIPACHWLKNKEVIVKFKDRKQRNEEVFKRKKQKSKVAELQAF